jgi:hypothetical protein
MFENIQDMNKKSIETTKKNFDVLSKGAQTIGSEVSDYSKKSIENGQKAIEKLMSAKSPQQAIEMQMEFAKSAMWPAPIEWSGGHVSLRLGAVPA